MSINLSDAAKAKELKAFFARHGRIYIVVDTTDEAVQLPEHLKGDPALRLVLNMRMPQPIRIGDDVLQSDFSFSGQVHACTVPMRAIWAAYLPEEPMEKGIVWEEDVPETIRAVVKAVRSLQEDQPADDEPVVEATGEGSGAEPESAEKKGEEEGGRRVRHLRVVK